MLTSPTFEASIDRQPTSGTQDLRDFAVQTFTSPSAESVKIIYPPASTQYSDQFFYRVGDALRFVAPVHGARTSPTAGGPRVELREIYGTNRSEGYAWRFGEDSHSIRVTMEIDRLPDSNRTDYPGQLCVLQLHTIGQGAPSVPAMVLASGTVSALTLTLFSPDMEAESQATSYGRMNGLTFTGRFTVQLGTDASGAITFCGIDTYGRAFGTRLDGGRFRGLPVYFKTGAYVELQANRTAPAGAKAIVTHHALTLTSNVQLSCPSPVTGFPAGTLIIVSCGGGLLMLMLLGAWLRSRWPAAWASASRREDGGLSEAGTGIYSALAQRLMPGLPTTAQARRSLTTLVTCDALVSSWILIVPLVLESFNPWTPDSLPYLTGRLRNDWLLVVPTALSTLRLAHITCLRTNTFDGAGYPEVCLVIGMCLVCLLTIASTLALSWCAPAAAA